MKIFVTRIGFALIRKSVLLLCVLAALCFSISAQDWKTLKDGVEYAEVTKEISGLKVNMNLLRLDLTKVRLDVHHAMDAAVGTEKTSSIASRHGAFAAINAGFFRLDTSIFAGDPAGVLQIDGNLISEPNNGREAIAIKNEIGKTEVSFGHIDVAGADLGLNSIVAFGVDSVVAFSGLNRERRSDEIILYTSYFNRSTLTDDQGTEIVLSECSISANVTRCKKVETREQRGSSLIPSDGYVISIANGAMEKSNNILHYANMPPSKRSGENVLRIVNKIEIKDPPKWKFFDEAEDITNGVPQLIKNSRIDITWKQAKTTKSFVETRHPRTAVAKLKDGKFLMITVDGRSESSGGIGLQDLAEYLLSLGATDAMNLDGGGSTTMSVEGKVVNHPSDKEGERKVGDAILVTLRHPQKR